MAKNETYEEFVEKFKPKLTTDDCYTPAIVYDCVRDWVCSEYGIAPKRVVRPFWPGGDYETFDYPDGCVVVDNPPFSILAKILDFYIARDIKFFLFCPTMTAAGTLKSRPNISLIYTDVTVVYENGAEIATSFYTTLNNGEEPVVRNCIEFEQALSKAVREYSRGLHKKLPRRAYPPQVISAARMRHLSRYKVPFAFRRTESTIVRTVGEDKVSIFGSAFLVNNAIAAEIEEAEKVAAVAKAEKVAAIAKAERGTKNADTTLTLSPRELDIIRSLGVVEDNESDKEDDPA